MADKQEKSPQQEQVKPKKNYEREAAEETLIRIAGYDIPGNKKLLIGLIRIKGVGWTISKAACVKLKISSDKKISELSKDEIAKIEKFLSNPEIQNFLKNRQKDVETGETKHFIGTDLEIKKDFDIRSMKKIKSYKGVRHIAKLPVRGQRTRSHFRKKGQAVRVRKKK